MQVTTDQVLEIVTKFIQGRSGEESLQIGENVKLLKEGLLDSFGMVELIVEIETKLDVVIPVGALIPEDFESVQVLQQRLLVL